MSEHRIFSTPFASVYPLYVQKAERKGRTRGELDQVTSWLTGYDQAGLEKAVRDERDLRGAHAWVGAAGRRHRRFRLTVTTARSLRWHDCAQP